MNLIKKMHTIIHEFDHEVTKLVLTIQASKTNTYKNLESLSPVDVDQRLHYLYMTLKDTVSTKFKILVMNNKENLANDAGDNWTIYQPDILTYQDL